MPFYDPTRCPDCGADLPVPRDRCAACALPLTGQTAVQLQATLRYADQLVGQLRRPAPLPAYRPAAPAPPVPRPARTTSVPAVLLGLGALCLLVAAMVFLAVAWSWLGVAGRTAVLVSLTAAAGGAGLWLGGRGLRVAAESLVVVALGLVLLDLAGAARSGWLALPESLPAGAYGAALVVVGLALASHPLRLAAPQLAAAGGLLVLVVDRAAVTDHDRLAAAAGVLAFGALAAVGRLLGVRLLPWLALAGGVGCWAALAGLGLLVAAEDPSLAALWLDGRALAPLAATGLLLLPAALPALRPARDGLLAGAGTLTTLVVVLPALDEGVTPALLTVAVAALTWTAAAAALPRGRLVVAVVPAALAATPLAVAVAALGTRAAARLAEVGAPFSEPVAVRLAPAATEPHPVVLLVAAVVVLATGLALLPERERRATAPWAAVPAALAVVGTLALLPVPLVVPALGLATTGAALALVRRVEAVVLGLALLGLALAAALPSVVLATGTATTLTAVAAVVALRPGTRRLGGALVPAGLAVAVWAAGEAVGLEPSYRSLVVLAAGAALAVPRPRVEVEAAAVVAAAVAAVAGIGTTTELAVHLTLAGALVTTNALLHPHRRLLGWPGGLLLAAATWVRLAEVGVTAPEAYTLPTAVALTVVGLHRVLRAGSGTTALVPGLTLATVPTLCWALADPLTARAVVLGLACLALVLAGAGLRWGAPLLVGGAVGATLVLREAAPYLAATPQWVLIGTAGALLTAFGITWERRVVELRRVGSYVEALR